MADLLQSIREVLSQKPGQTAREVAGALARQRIRADKSAINSLLYRNVNRGLANDGAQPPRWHCVALTGAPRVRPVPPPVETAGAPRRTVPLYVWQRQALEAWRDQGYRGVVEAVTGTGKTRVGMVAIQDALSAGGLVHVLVPTIDLQEQWCRELELWFPRRRRGKRGNHHDAQFPDFEIIVSVVNSARDYEIDHLPRNSLLIADECHRYGADGNARALKEVFTRRLGLTATYAREDEGNAEYLDPYFGDTCFQIGYTQAVEDEVTAHFKVALVGVDFETPIERARYEEASKASSSARKWLTENGWTTDEPFGEFMKDVVALGKDGPRRKGLRDQYTAVGKARNYLKAFAAKRTLLADTAAKTRALKGLLSTVVAASRTIVFTETIEAAQAADELLRAHNISSAAVHSQMALQERKLILRRFSSGEVTAITAPRVLDEGIDVPAADLAIIFATTKTRRQMVQRMGRVLRRKEDGRLARFIVLFVKDTSEAPGNGAHESFLNEITDVAEDVRSFDLGAECGSIVSYVNAFVMPGGQPAARMTEV